MKFNYDAFKQTFVDYFSTKGYKTLVSNRDKNLIFMYSLKDDVSVIEIYNAQQESPVVMNELDRLLKKISKIKEIHQGDLKVVKLIYDPTATQHTMLDDNRFSIISNNLDFFKTKLQGKWNDVVNVNPITNEAEFKKITSSKKMTKDEAEDLSGIQTQEQLQQKVNQLTLNMKQNRGFGPMFYMIAFLVIPLIGAIVCMVWGANGYGLEASRLFQGGTNYYLSILGKQAWRILTWGFSTPSDNFIIAVLVILVAGWSAFNMMKLSEFNMKPWKFFIGFFAAYVLTGYFSSVLFRDFAVGGVMPILGIAAGMLALSTSAKKTLVAAVSKMKLVWPIVLMVIFPIFTGGGYEYAAEIMGFATGGAIGYLISYNYKEVSWTIILPIFVLLVVAGLPSIMFAVPTYVPGVDQNVIYTLAMMVKKNILSVNHAQDIINNIGWDNITINSTNGILSIPYSI